METTRDSSAEGNAPDGGSSATTASLGLPMLSTGLNFGELDLTGGEGLWPEVERICRVSSLGQELDDAIAGRAAPRIWAILGAEATAAGLLIARLLADRGQLVTLLDADEDRALLTHLIGRHEQEGWIDIVRYGASRTNASDTLPSPGRRGAVVGVGSFAPTGANPEEIGELVARLRRQSDDLIIVVPAEPAAAPWCRTADIRLLVWDQLERTPEEIGRLVDALRAQGIILEGLVGFGVDEFAALERLTPFEDLPQPEPTAGGPVFPDPAEVAAAREAALEAPVAPRRGGKTALLRLAAVLAGLAVLAVGYYLLNANRRTADPPRRVATREVVANEPVRASSDTASIARTSSPIAAESTITRPPVVTPAQEPAPTPAPVPPADQAGFDLAPYRSAVGEAGWALWIISQKTEAMAAVDIASLRRQGIQAVARAVDLPEKGRWYRIYVGNFPSRAAAQEAAPALLAHLHHDWAQAARF